MLTDYIKAAMRRATYKSIGDGTILGEIAGLDGLWANAKTLESCRDELESVLEGWIVLGLRLGHELPIIDGMNLTPPLIPMTEEEEALI